MAFRFRKIISLGKGMRLNFSKRGVSSSIGIPGATLNIGKRGIRPTVGLPGTGLSFTPSQGGGSTAPTAGASGLAVNTIVFVISLVLVCVIAICCVGLLFTNTDQAAVTTSTPKPIEINSFATFVAGTSRAAQAQTIAAFTPLPSQTLAPTITPESTATIFITKLQTVVAQPTEYIYLTNTPFSLATQSDNPPAIGNCSCGADTLNCSNFSTHKEAQACFDYCVSQGSGDIHKLDQNNDGDACESLP